jgi:ribosomal protein S18 acetylase RimI-like enzyme
MRYAVYRLDEDSRAALVAHFLSLSAADRRLRFGKALSSEAIAGYVDRIDLDSDAVFVVRDAEHVLAGAVHVAMGDDAELGVSVLPAHRGRGVAHALLNRAVSHARNRSADRVVMHCAADNVPILRLARKFGMDIAARGGEATARLDVRPAFSMPVARDFMPLSMAA